MLIVCVFIFSFCLSYGLGKYSNLLCSEGFFSNSKQVGGRDNKVHSVPLDQSASLQPQPIKYVVTVLCSRRKTEALKDFWRPYRNPRE